MNKIFRKAMASVFTVGMLISPIMAKAASVAGGELNYTGGQTAKVVWSDIRDAKPNNDNKYKVIAKVKVGSSIYTSGWKDDQAYIDHSRHWYTNEKSFYDYYKRN